MSYTICKIHLKTATNRSRVCPLVSFPSCYCQFISRALIDYFHKPKGAGRSIIGGANIHIFVFCTINFFWNRNLDFKVNCFYSLWTRIYEYWPPQLSIFRHPCINRQYSSIIFGFDIFFKYMYEFWKSQKIHHNFMKTLCFNYHEILKNKLVH